MARFRSISGGGTSSRLREKGGGRRAVGEGDRKCDSDNGDSGSGGNHGRSVAVTVTVAVKATVTVITAKVASKRERGAMVAALSTISKISNSSLKPKNRSRRKHVRQRFAAHVSGARECGRLRSMRGRPDSTRLAETTFCSFGSPLHHFSQ
jgi:hypothetical protein